MLKMCIKMSSFYEAYLEVPKTKYSLQQSVGRLYYNMPNLFTLDSNKNILDKMQTNKNN